MASMSGLPLDKKKIIVGDSRKPQSALDARWMKKRGFVAYVAPPKDSNDQGLVGEWLERLQYICTDLHWLLQLPHQQFWCQAIFDESLHRTLDSFIRYSPRPYDIPIELPGNSSDLHNQVTRLVFFTYVRMATYKESKENWLTPKVFGNILYENFLFDIPKLMDLCSLYGHSNGPLLSKMVNNVFTQQPKYLDDLRATVPTILEVFSNIAVKCNVRMESYEHGVPQKLSSRGDQSRDLVSMDMKDLQDIVLYLADTAISVSTFLKIYPSACAVLHQMDFGSNLAHFYENVIPAVQSAVKQRSFETERQKKLLRNKLRQAKSHLLTTFHLIVAHVCLDPVFKAISEENGTENQPMSQYLENFLTIMSAVLGEKRFLADYEGQFSFQDDLDILTQAVGDVHDDTSYSYISEAINSAYAAHGKRKKPKGNTNTGGRTSPDGSPCPALAQSSGTKSTCPFPASSGASSQSSSANGATASAAPCQGAEAPCVTGVELESLVSCVKDLLPHLGNGFVQMALEQMGYSAEAVINAVLEDSLPAALRHVDLALDKVNVPPPPQKEEAPAEPSLVDSRKNIYDYDEFDVFHNPSVDVSRIHKGKKQIDSRILDDKKGLQELKPVYAAYGSMDVKSMYDDARLYDDEYDDTYDANDMGAEDPDSADEIRPFTVPQVLRKPPERKPKVESSSKEDEAPRDQFVQDPAKLREKREQKQQATWKRKPPPSRDVKGQAKGQGQTHEVLRNRRFKETNKGSRANHNRRAMADKKHSKGMF